MGYFTVRYDSRVVIYERKMFIRLATGVFGDLKITLLRGPLRALNLKTDQIGFCR